VDQYSNSNVPGTQQWQSAMTYKLVGALKGITDAKPHVMQALQLGIALGLLIEIARKLIKRSRRYQRFAKESRAGPVTDFAVDALILPSPYASSFGGFVELPSVLWWTAGGVSGALYDRLRARLRAPRENSTGTDLPPDMSTTSLVGGGLIAGDSLAALSVGVYGLLKTVW